MLNLILAALLVAPCAQTKEPQPADAARIELAVTELERAFQKGKPEERATAIGAPFTIVGAAEAAPREGRISNESPVGAALMGRKKGEKVTVNAPSGPIEYTLVRIG
jgi:hypothetical protein